jgi:hypothetical protein
MREFRQILAIALLGAGVLAATGNASAPLISVDPERGIPGQLVVVTGRGFCGSPQCGPVSIQVYGAIAAQGLRVSRSGRFVRPIRIPGGAPTGEVGLIAMQQAADGSELEAFASFEMAVRLRSPMPPNSEQSPEPSGGAPSPPERSNGDSGSGSAPERSSGDRRRGPVAVPSQEGARAQPAGARSYS